MTTPTQAQTRQLLIRRAATGGIVLLVGLVVAAAGSFYGSARLERVEQLRGSINMLQSERDRIIAERGSLKEAMEVYHQLFQGADPSFVIDREHASTLLGELNDQFRLNNLQAQISPLQWVEQPPVPLAHTQMMRSEITLKFAAITDEYVYQFLDVLKQRLAGYVVIQQFTLTRKESITGELLAGVADGQIPYLVEGEVTLDWIGLQKPEENTVAAP